IAWRSEMTKSVMGSGSRAGVSPAIGSGAGVSPATGASRPSRFAGETPARHRPEACATNERERSGSLRDRTERALERAMDFLIFRAQRPDGSWVPLWFGNQHSRDDENPVYGTARVLPALVEGIALEGHPFATRLAAVLKASAWLTANQHADGSWGGGGAGTSSVEETALAVEALAAVLSLEARLLSSRPDIPTAVGRGVAWLLER